MPKAVVRLVGCDEGRGQCVAEGQLGLRLTFCLAAVCVDFLSEGIPSCTLCLYRV